MTTVATTGFMQNAKWELPSAAHCFLAINSQTGTTTNASNNITSLTSISGIAVGMSVSGTNVPASAIVSRLASQTSITFDGSAATGSAANTMTFTGDTLKMLLLKPSTSISTTYTASSFTNVGTPGTGTPSATNVGTDETSGTGYTAYGAALTNVSPALSSSAGVWSFSNVSWTTATITSGGGVIYNTSPRLGSSANGITANASGSAINRPVGVYSFSGDQSVTGGTFTVQMPTDASGTAILQLS